MYIDKLPHRDQDPVLTLSSHYFQAAALMKQNHDKLYAKLKKNGRWNNKDSVNYSIYFCTWLGFLAVTCEGFKGLALRVLLAKNRPEQFSELTSISDAIGRKINKHVDALRVFRNKIFHLREDHSVIEQFFEEGVERVSWAEDLHADFANFFSRYRVMCETHYIVHGRDSESRLLKKER